MRHDREVIVNSVVHMTERLIEREPSLRGLRGEKIGGVARRIGVAANTIRNLLSGRLKGVERVESRVRVAFIRMLEQEIAQATHELEIARMVTDRMDSTAVLEAEAAVLAAKKRVEELKAPHV